MQLMINSYRFFTLTHHFWVDYISHMAEKPHKDSSFSREALLTAPKRLSAGLGYYVRGWRKASRKEPEKQTTSSFKMYYRTPWELRKGTFPYTYLSDFTSAGFVPLSFIKYRRTCSFSQRILTWAKEQKYSSAPHLHQNSGLQLIPTVLHFSISSLISGFTFSMISTSCWLLFSIPLGITNTLVPTVAEKANTSAPCGNTCTRRSDQRSTWVSCVLPKASSGHWARIQLTCEEGGNWAWDSHDFHKGKKRGNTELRWELESSTLMSLGTRIFLTRV